MMKWNVAFAVVLVAGCKSSSPPAENQAGTQAATAAAPAPVEPKAQWEIDNPVQPLPTPPLGVQADWKRLKWTVTPEKVRLGKWLYFDTRLSADNTLSCASCHHPENAFSEVTPVSTGIKGQKGTRKAPSFVNGAWPLFETFFWDGRAASLAEQAKGPVQNPIEMGNTHEKAVASIAAASGYKKAFKESFGDDKIDIDRIAEAIASYESTRMSGNSAYDRFDNGEQGALNEKQKKGREVFFSKALCSQCHLGWNFTDSQFHNLGIGWDASKLAKSPKAAKPPADPKTAFADIGRSKISNKEEDTGAFKTPTLRDVSKHAPYMHDGSLKTLKEVVEHYNKGGNPNPWLSKKVFPLKLTSEEVDQVVAFMEALDGTGYQDTAPKSFPQ